MNEIVKTLKKWNSVFCDGMTCKTNVKRDVMVVIAAILAAAAFLFIALRSDLRDPAPIRTDIATTTTDENIGGDLEGIVAGEITSEPLIAEEKISAEVEKVIEVIDSSSWKVFSNQFWGFTVKYPADWLSPKSQIKSGGSKWEARYQFSKRDVGENPYIGFDVVVYDVPKTKQLANTEEYPSLKTSDLKNEERCQNIEGHAIEVDDFTAEEIYIPPTDDCFNQALFFSIIKDRYIYNVVPVLREDEESINDPRVGLNENFPEYYAAASTLDLVNIVRPKPAPPKPRITAPKPVSFKVVGGKLVCAKKNDKPRKSKQNKGRHLDMECCLDPDEDPNPWCTY